MAVSLWLSAQLIKMPFAVCRHQRIPLSGKGLPSAQQLQIIQNKAHILEGLRHIVVDPHLSKRRLLRFGHEQGRLRKTILFLRNSVQFLTGRRQLRQGKPGTNFNILFKQSPHECFRIGIGIGNRRHKAFPELDTTTVFRAISDDLSNPEAIGRLFLIGEHLMLKLWYLSQIRRENKRLSGQAVCHSTADRIENQLLSQRFALTAEDELGCLILLQIDAQLLRRHQRVGRGQLPAKLRFLLCGKLRVGCVERAKLFLRQWEGGVKREGDLRDCSDTFRAAVTQAKETLSATGDPQLADFQLDRAYFREMAQAAADSGSEFLQGYVKLLADAANLRSSVRAHRMGKGGDFLALALVPGGNVDERSILSAKGGDLTGLFRGGRLAAAAELGAALLSGGGGSFTAFERACDNAVTDYLSQARRIAFGEHPVIGYLYAREAEVTAIRTILSGRMAGLSAETIRERLRESYV